ncbi:MAG: DUF2442 domain-containing protein [Eubacteriales bacterium]|nr:DUF2442 domain-containing protein [Eubacteriales bacterium]
MKSGSDKEMKDTKKVRMKNNEHSSIIVDSASQSGEGYFKSVKALPEYQLEVEMETGTIILFDFRSRLNTVRFGKLRDEEMFTSVHTDGLHLIFSKKGKVHLKIVAKEFMDLVLVDRTRPTHMIPE